MEWGNKTLLVMVGPTAVGKTDLCVQLAQELKTEIIILIFCNSKNPRVIGSITQETMRQSRKFCVIKLDR